MSLVSKFYISNPVLCYQNEIFSSYLPLEGGLPVSVGSGVVVCPVVGLGPDVVIGGAATNL